VYITTEHQNIDQSQLNLALQGIGWAHKRR